MKCFVTGASGFIGANLVHALNAHGHAVKALLRPDSDRRGLAGADYEPVAANLLDGPALTNALRGCDWCFHVAASYHLWLPDYAPMYAANVEGTRTVLTAAAEADCRRIVYTSTVGCLALPEHGPAGVIPADESQTAPLTQVLKNPYKHSKWLAEEVARKLAAQGMPIVIVNPSAPVGPRDVKPTPTGQIIVDFLERRLPAFLDTGLNWVHVRDVAEGHLLAAEKGRTGERYLLGNQAGNWTLKQALDTLAEITGIPAPRFQAPYWLAYGGALLSEAWSSLSKRPPKAPLAGVRMARYKMFFDPAKAIRDLNLPQTPPRQALAEAVEWFRRDNPGGAA